MEDNRTICEIDAEEFRKFFKNQGITMTEIAHVMGVSYRGLNMMLEKGKIKKSYLRLLRYEIPASFKEMGVK